MAQQSIEPWRNYREGGKDIAEREIVGIVARDPSFVIYTTKSQENVVDQTGAPVYDYHIDGDDVARSHLAEANILVAKIHSLAPKNSRYRIVIDKQLAGAYELALRDKIDKCNTILQDVLSQLETAQVAKGQLWYMMANVAGCALVWFGYVMGRRYHAAEDGAVIIWVLAGALGTLGGILSVAINLKTIQIGVHQPWYIQVSAGWARNIVAFLGGIVCLLAIRGKIVLHLASTDQTQNLIGAGLVVSEAFFCFLAGFSESLVPNILRDGEQEARNKDTSQSANKTPLDAAHAEAQKARAEADDAEKKAATARAGADAAAKTAVEKRAVATQARNAAAENAATEAEAVHSKANQDADKASNAFQSKKEIADRLSRVAVGSARRA